jgi:hypothetical protein
MGEGLPITYGYLCDLASANGWRVTLPLLDDGRHSLRVMEGEVILVGVKFALAECPLDEIAETVFSELHDQGRV